MLLSRGTLDPSFVFEFNMESIHPPFLSVRLSVSSVKILHYPHPDDHNKTLPVVVLVKSDQQTAEDDPS